MSDRTPETPAPTLAEAARVLIQLWDRSDTRPAAPSRVAAGYEALRAALDAHEAAGAARLLAAVRAPAQADPLAAEVCRLQDEVRRLQKALRTVTCAFCGGPLAR
jgi:hypothetical protein